ncbi:MAG TPA: pseudouridine-5'-phosphate glycosidase [Nannocystis exedens]|nr:pseudouridine-5'-phosphate glycosidase [Nannocystis exedens]
MNTSDSPIAIHPEIRTALGERRPVVALETAVLTHGLPRPKNLEAVHAMAATITAEGAVAAVIAVIQGRLQIGLDARSLEMLADDRGAHKLGARDLAMALSCGLSGGTTVSGTLVGARWAGIQVFATGGIGGVHRGWQDHRDISSDLQELTRTRCCTVSAGAKSILDLPATLEALETLAIPVLGWRTATFPQFYTRGQTDLEVRRVDDLQTVARLCSTRWKLLDQTGGVLLTQPLGPELALDQRSVDLAVGDAVKRATAEGIRGQALTPYLLAALSELTDGDSLRANLALLVANARLAARLACALTGDQQAG